MDINYYKQYEPLFGSWEIKELIGEGGFGKVYKIERNELGITYDAALKIITIPQSQSEINSVKADGMTDGEVTAYFEEIVHSIVNEFVLMSQMKGTSNIVSYEDHQIIQHEEGIGWDILIKMELLTPLYNHLDNNEYTPDAVVRMGIDLCKSLELCQKRNIVHRDVKPENIFISSNGDYKLGDFGIARIIEKTASGLSRKGTFLYMAPEIYLGKPYGPTVDIYSLGLVMYRLLNNNRMPFFPEYPKPIAHADREKALVERVSGKKLPKPSNADDILGAIVLKACEYNPENRYHSASELRKELEQVLRKMENKNLSEKNESEIIKSNHQKEIVKTVKDTAVKSKKNKKSAIITASIIVVIIALVIAVSPLGHKEIEDITGIDSEIEMMVGDELSPGYSIKPEKYSDEEITFTVSDEDIISVDENGVITAKKEGEAILTITVCDYVEEITITVEEPEEETDDGYYYYYNYPSYDETEEVSSTEETTETETPSVTETEPLELYEDTEM